MKRLLPFQGLLLLLWIVSIGSLHGQGRDEAKKTIPAAALEHIKKNKNKLELSDQDIADLVVSNEYTSKHNGIKHVYLLQRYQGIEIHGSLTNINITQEGKVLNMGNRLHKDIGKKVKATQPKLSAAEAVGAAARYLKTPLKESLAVQKPEDGANRSTLFSTGGISLEPIPARLVYQPMDDGSLRLAWEVSIYELDAQNWWNLRLDAVNGEVLDKDNLVVHCQFDNNGPGGTPLHRDHNHVALSPQMLSRFESLANGAGQYNIYPIPVESPNHGDRTVVTGAAAHPTASPSGWHHSPGGAFTTTKGNNVLAYEDPNNNNNFNTNYSPEGGADLIFNFPIDFAQQPVDYRDAAITNLFYWNNVMHDVWYQYGFDEVSGNFQWDNFGRGGSQADPVLAEAQDSRNILTTRNNANFATGADGFAPRMQMYLWSGLPDQNMFRVTSPSSIEGSYPAIEAAVGFSERLTSTPITGKLVLVDDGLPNPEGCVTNPINNPEAIAGNIAVVYRGSCPFVEKVQRAQAAGAIAVVVINNAPGSPITMGGASSPLTVPALMISLESGQIIRQVMDNGIDVFVALKNDGPGPELDGDFDNGIIAHEYGHGISNRLTGGRTVANCLNNAEQAGEGWSDWFALMMTMREGDTPGMRRGIGTYVIHEPTNGQGIRPAPYSTDFAVNNYTYGRTNEATLSAPHGIGFVFATALWDMTWALVDRYGFDSDLYHGTGGNNIAMQLVIDGLKLQVCRPGFIDSRDAILLADRINYGGANQELLWNVFARRGFGYSASQGLNTSRFDQTEAFDLPAEFPCQIPLAITAVPTSNVFTGGVPTTLYLGYGPQSVMLQASGDETNSYEWSPAAGLNHTNIANPLFTPDAPGTYTFTVKAVNEDMCTKYASITITVIDVRCGDKKKDKGKVMVCINGDNTCVASNAVAGMLSEGGTLGTCGLNAPIVEEEGPVFITSVGNHPNPFNESTTLTFTVESSGYATLKVYDLRMSREVATLYAGNAEAGVEYTTEFRAPNRASGLYAYKLISGNTVKTGLMLLQETR